MLRELNGVVDRLKHGPSQSPQRRETSDNSGDETDTSKVRVKILSKETFRMKKVYGASDLGRFIVTGPTEAANNPGRFYSPVCFKNVSVLSYGHHEMLRRESSLCPGPTTAVRDTRVARTRIPRKSIERE